MRGTWSAMGLVLILGTACGGGASKPSDGSSPTDGGDDAQQGVACRSDDDCTEGTATTCCDGRCTDAESDPGNCGACGFVCSAPAHGAASCEAGSCGLDTCDPGYKDCDQDVSNGCEAHTAADPMNCGACGAACPLPAQASAACTGGVCGLGPCQPDYGDCDGNPANGCEALLDSDPAHCGACDTPCAFAHAGATCDQGACKLGACESGWGDCDGNPANGCEADLRTNANCGACGAACTGATSCLSTIAGPVDGSWQLNGTAAQDGSNVVLTEDAHDQKGSVVFKRAISLTSFDASFDLQISAAGSIGDGMGFFFVTDGPSALSPAGGGELGMGDLHGYGVEFDTYQNIGCDSEQEPSNRHVGIDVLTDTPTCSGAPSRIARGVSDFVDGKSHRVRVTLDGGAISVWLDGALAISGYALPGFVSGTLYSFGFSAATGDYSAKHVVDNVQIAVPPVCAP